MFTEKLGSLARVQDKAVPDPIWVKRPSHCTTPAVDSFHGKLPPWSVQVMLRSAQ